MGERLGFSTACAAAARHSTICASRPSPVPMYKEAIVRWCCSNAILHWKYINASLSTRTICKPKACHCVQCTHQDSLKEVCGSAEQLDLVTYTEHGGELLSLGQSTLNSVVVGTSYQKEGVQRPGLEVYAANLDRMP